MTDSADVEVIPASIDLFRAALALYENRQDKDWGLTDCASFVVGLVGAMAWYVLAGAQPLVGRIADEMGTFVPVFRVMACVPMVGSVVGLWWRGEVTSQRQADAIDGA